MRYASGLCRFSGVVRLSARHDINGVRLACVVESSMPAAPFMKKASRRLQERDFPCFTDKRSLDDVDYLRAVPIDDLAGLLGEKSPQRRALARTSTLNTYSESPGQFGELREFEYLHAIDSIVSLKCSMKSVP